MSWHTFKICCLFAGDVALAVDEALEIHGIAACESRGKAVGVVCRLLRVGGWEAVVVGHMVRWDEAPSCEPFHGVPEWRRDTFSCSGLKCVHPALEETRFVGFDAESEASRKFDKIAGACRSYELPPSK